MLVAPLSRTPMDRKGAQNQRTYSQKLQRSLEMLTPWSEDTKFNALRRKYGPSMRGEAQVIVSFDANDDPNSPLFKDAITTRIKKKSKAED